MKPFTPQVLRRFYAKAFEEADAHKRWDGLWRKQIKVRFNGSSVSIN